MLQTYLKNKGVNRNIRFRSIDISAGGEDAFNAIFRKAIDGASNKIEAALPDIERLGDVANIFKTIKNLALQAMAAQKKEIAALFSKEAALYNKKLAENVKSVAKQDVSLLLSDINDVTDIANQAAAQLETTVMSFIDAVQAAILDFKSLGYIRDEQANDIETVSQKLKRLNRNKKARAKNAAKQSARNILGNANARNAQNAAKKLGLELYVWRTMKDDKVRASHEEREGVVYNWSDPPEGGHPSEDWGCRCIASPFYKGSDSAFDQRQNFKCF